MARQIPESDWRPCPRCSILVTDLCGVCKGCYMCCSCDDDLDDESAWDGWDGPVVDDDTLPMPRGTDFHDDD